MIGGYADSQSYSKKIARLDSSSYEWSRAGDLLTGRYGHNAIFNGNDIIVVGGYAGDDVSVKTEKCKITEGNVTCVEQDPALVDYAYYPELFRVEDGYCKEITSLWLLF